MPFSVKDWKSGQAGGTPLDAVGQEDKETRLAAYTDSRVQEYASARWTAIYFGGDDAGDPTQDNPDLSQGGPRLYLAVSADMDNWKPHGPPLSSASTTPRHLRDPDVIDYAGKLWLNYTHAVFSGTQDYFGLQRSENGGLTWIAMPDVSVASAASLIGGTVTRCWAERWFLDPAGGRPWAVLSITSGDDWGPFQRIAVQATSDDFTSWGTPILCSTGLPTSTLDYSPVLHTDGVWHLFAKEQPTFASGLPPVGNDTQQVNKIIHATGSSWLGPWTVDNSNVLGTGWYNTEAAECVRNPTNDGYRLYFDHYVDPPASSADQGTNWEIDGWWFRHATTYYCKSVGDSLTSWSTPIQSRGLGRHVRIRPIRNISMDQIGDTATNTHIEIRKSANLFRASGEFTNMGMDTDIEDPDYSWWINRPDVIVIRNGGLYMLQSWLWWTASTSAGGNGRYVEIEINNVYIPGLTDKRSVSLNMDSHLSAGPSICRLRRGDELRLKTWQDSGINLSQGSPPSPTIKATRIGN